MWNVHIAVTSQVIKMWKDDSLFSSAILEYLVSNNILALTLSK